MTAPSSEATQLFVSYGYQAPELQRRLRLPSVAITAHELGVRENMAAHRLLYLSAFGARFEFERGVQSEQLEVIAMWFPRRGIGSAVADAVEVVAPLHGSVAHVAGVGRVVGG